MNVKQASLAVSQSDAFYIPTTQWPWVDAAQSLVVRTQGDPATLTSAVKNAIWSVDKDQPIVRVATMNSLLISSEADRRFALTLFEAFGMVALVLAAVGIYGVLSGGVNERLREIGVRAALGASRRNILLLVIRQGMMLTGIGVVLGVLGAVLAEPSRGFLAVRRVALRPNHLSLRDRAAGGRFGRRMLGAGVACGSGGSLDHAEGGIEVTSQQVGQQRTGGPHISLVFREMWDSTDVNRQVHRMNQESGGKSSGNP